VIARRGTNRKKGIFEMQNLMCAEILLFDPANLAPATAELMALGFRIKVREDMIDDGGPTIFIRATGFTEHSLATFFGWMQTIVEPLGGDVWDADHARADISGADHVEIDQMTANNNRKVRAIT
jgi:hypothetical protein